MVGAWTYDWAWGLSLITLTVMLHGFAVIGIAFFFAHVKVKLIDRQSSWLPIEFILVPIFGLIGWTLAFLHGVAAAIWAVAYIFLGAIKTPREAVFYSVDSLTARGASGLELEPQWKLMGALEAADGLLLFGISTAFLATAITEIWTLLHKEREINISN